MVNLELFFYDSGNKACFIKNCSKSLQMESIYAHSYCTGWNLSLGKLSLRLFVSFEYIANKIVVT